MVSLPSFNLKVDAPNASSPETLSYNFECQAPGWLVFLLLNILHFFSKWVLHLTILKIKKTH